MGHADGIEAAVRAVKASGLRVTGLKRVRIGHVRLGDLPLGQWRFLRDGERF